MESKENQGKAGWAPDDDPDRPESALNSIPKSALLHAHGLAVFQVIKAGSGLVIIGTGGSVQAGLAHLAPMFSYSKSKGRFAGLSLEGTVLIERRDTNQEFYGSPVPVRLGVEGLDETGVPQAVYVPSETGRHVLVEAGDGHIVFDADG
ncbi:hypothetical protein BJ138DRAFT_1114864 [Hygrophoropsis aurantiaca]|uniref:Uncharacterized protein n=1 Tax=Hygrophoropsis aurantiaca TaxID=72124 RepID=A0ACB8A7V2_9AGAM|nr:hypothetical protein BJ138DRAFT_1114864 [Hygrophoropsis aurantiaca]